MSSFAKNRRREAEKIKAGKELGLQKKVEVPKEVDVTCTYNDVKYYWNFGRHVEAGVVANRIVEWWNAAHPEDAVVIPCRPLGPLIDKKWLRAFCEFCLKYYKPSVISAPSFSVPNGLNGCGSDIISKLLDVISIKSDDLKIKAIMGMNRNSFELKNKKFFKNSRKYSFHSFEVKGLCSFNKLTAKFSRDWLSNGVLILKQNFGARSFKWDVVVSGLEGKCCVDLGIVSSLSQISSPDFGHHSFGKDGCSGCFQVEPSCIALYQNFHYSLFTHDPLPATIHCTLEINAEEATLSLFVNGRKIAEEFSQIPKNVLMVITGDGEFYVRHKSVGRVLTSTSSSVSCVKRPWSV